MSNNSDALGSVLFFGVTLAILMVVLFDNKTHLSIDEEGIRSSNIGMVLFPWGEIDQVKLRSFLWIKFIQIDLTNPKEFKKKIPFSLKFMLLSSKVSFLPEFMLSVGGLEYRPNKILSIIEERLRLLGNYIKRVQWTSC